MGGERYAVGVDFGTESGRAVIVSGLAVLVSVAALFFAQDIIFSGSDRRGPLGYCEVSLTFENDGRVPIDYLQYTEITVGRRLFRRPLTPGNAQGGAASRRRPHVFSSGLRIPAQSLHGTIVITQTNRHRRVSPRTAAGRTRPGGSTRERQRSLPDQGRPRRVGRRRPSAANPAAPGKTCAYR